MHKNFSCFYKITVHCQSKDYLKDIPSVNTNFKIPEFKSDFSDIQKRINKQSEDVVAQVNYAVAQAKKNAENASKFTLPKFNATNIDIEKVQKQFVSLTKTIENVMGQVVDVASTVNGTRVNLGEDELRSSVNKIFKIISTIGEALLKN